ncbi:hypothetical protein [Bradyrhizobium sp. DOA9]|uniref:hypothetical protein n=1 Tax=Bradyrhizobium sp. DOA9 TaxID=1126627 RepID=UPI0012602CFF|nr:hypothetical protein [Bradyrhizobium sp. DOA9]
MLQAVAQGVRDRQSAGGCQRHCGPSAEAAPEWDWDRLIIDWLALGYTHESFWDQTPRTLALTFEAARIRQRREHNERMVLAWHTAFLPRQKRPNFKKLLARGSQASRPRQTAEQQWAIFGAIAEAAKVSRKN